MLHFPYRRSAWGKARAKRRPGAGAGGRSPKSWAKRTTSLPPGVCAQGFFAYPESPPFSGPRLKAGVGNPWNTSSRGVRETDPRSDGTRISHPHHPSLRTRVHSSNSSKRLDRDLGGGGYSRERYGPRGRAKASSSGPNPTLRRPYE